MRAGPKALALLLAALAFPSGAAAATNDIFTVAGNGVRGSLGDGGLATRAQLNNPRAVAAMADGGYVIADPAAQRVRRVSPTGRITTAAGTGVQGFSGDGGPATAARLSAPIAVAATSDGGFLIADVANQRVRRVSLGGTITTVAGRGTAGFSGDGGPATAAQLNVPIAVAVTGDGGFLIADNTNERIRRVSPTGTITTAAGNGGRGFSGDGGAATAARLDSPFSVAATRDGGFVIADTNNFRVRRVSPTGTITTAAGDGTFGFSGDGGPATAAQLNDPNGVAGTPDGGFLIADPFAARVRRVSPAGRITTVAGSGVAGFAGDGGLATGAQLNRPNAVAATGDGGFLVADSENARVRFVDADLRGPAGAPAPAVTSPRLAVALAGSRLRTHPGQRLTVRYSITRAARVRAKITGHGTRRVRSSWAGRHGHCTLRLRAPRRPGHYTLRLSAASPDGQRASDRARLDVARR